jgi:ribosome-associated protein
MMKGKEKNFEEPTTVSKSQRRREALEIKSLALELINLSQSKLGRVPLDDMVRAAIMEARQFNSHGARKRQMLYVAKLLRRDDPEPILLALEKFDGEAREITGRQHRSEAWRDFLLEAGDTAIGELMKCRMDTDVQAIRQLIRNASREAARNKPPVSARSLFRILREMDQKEPLPAVSDSLGVIGTAHGQAIDS